MARKKTITKDQILKATYELVEKEGLGKFTARNIAAKMKCSTQPIYLEFKNMDDLRSALIGKIFEHLEEDVFPREHTNDRLVDFCLNYIDFATKENHLYRALFIVGHGGEPVLQGFSFEYFKKLVIADEEYAKLPEAEVEKLFVSLLVVASGISSMIYSGVIAPSQEQTVRVLKEVLATVQQKQSAFDLNYIAAAFK
ncbi:TetR/AcrR family transcriptional regulator [Enterococcus columbae]|uniref:HTH tetR-type domain-containing protein n=1 Tax=Enterococcus columbae DSM 7374 = ATCC 51263 TaxID=1121865 RepID=S0KHA5_9ENTE|nr:TetR/AcrR family transcriptional regulator [Enterococcus columbae]EOT40320.1 hypothetical protein OMW_01574 [Enterococcus columbae DSM 7374 = ATCC 51263]EOW84058.1 hypothetical protein I568_01217 [Enterococcus columbae DSM 7374 = ATCC 51263]OJG25418.1 hypothetical protein RR47_GL001863 [Enterococcus columbae DSM 7374 = ATCC 51263]